MTPKQITDMSLPQLLFHIESITENVTEAQTAHDELIIELNASRKVLHIYKEQSKLLRAYATALLGTDIPEKQKKIQETFQAKFQAAEDKKNRHLKDLEASRNTVASCVEDLFSNINKAQEQVKKTAIQVVTVPQEVLL